MQEGRTGCLTPDRFSQVMRLECRKRSGPAKAGCEDDILELIVPVASLFRRLTLETAY